MKNLILAVLFALPGTSKVVNNARRDVVVVTRGGVAPRAAVSQSARNQLAWIFDRVGLRVAWSEVPSPASFIIELRYENEAPKGVTGEALAFTRPFGEGRFRITILYDRVRFIAKTQSMEATLLAYVAAHELGHILQRTNAHAASGIMKAHWSGDDYCLMERRQLAFTATDVDLIRSGLVSLTANRADQDSESNLSGLAAVIDSPRNTRKAANSANPDRQF